MGARLAYGTAGATGGGWSSQPGSTQLELGDARSHPRYSWQRRSPHTRADQVGWSGLWSFGCRVGGGDLEGYAASGGGGLTDADPFEPFSCDGSGTQSIKFILGQCVDASDVAVADASVQAFVASTGAVAGEAVSSRSDGSYAAPTQSPGVFHFIRAYKVGSPDVSGVTLAKLLPANLDGT